MGMGACGSNKNRCDYDIVYLHKTFLTAGLHVLPRSLLDDGHLLIETFLASLSRNSSVAFLGVSRSVPEGITLLYDEFRSYRFAYHAIDTFLLEEFYYSLCWIEYTTELARCSWFKHFCRRLYDFNLFGVASVIVFV